MSFFRNSTCTGSNTTHLTLGSVAQNLVLRFSVDAPILTLGVVMTLGAGFF